MIMTTEPPLNAARSSPGPLRFSARDVTGTHLVESRGVERATPAGAVARSLAARLELPLNVPWALRDDRNGDYLDDQQEIGQQIENDAQLTLTPKTHLG